MEGGGGQSTFLQEGFSHSMLFIDHYTRDLPWMFSFFSTAVRLRPATRKPTAAQWRARSSRQWSFRKRGQSPSFESGQWTFYGGQFAHSPDDYKPFSRTNAYAMVPEYPGTVTWANFGIQKWTRLRHLQADGARSSYEIRVLALRVPNIFSAYTLWINGKEMAAARAKWGQAAATSGPEQYPRIVSFASETDKVEIVIQVSNFQHRKGGSGLILARRQQPYR